MTGPGLFMRGIGFDAVSSVWASLRRKMVRGEGFEPELKRFRLAGHSCGITKARCEVIFAALSLGQPCPAALCFGSDSAGPDHRPPVIRIAISSPCLFHRLHGAKPFLFRARGFKGFTFLFCEIARYSRILFLHSLDMLAINITHSTPAAVLSYF
jgi:hypothetical protein